MVIERVGCCAHLTEQKGGIDKLTSTRHQDGLVNFGVRILKSLLDSLLAKPTAGAYLVELFTNSTLFESPAYVPQVTENRILLP